MSAEEHTPYYSTRVRIADVTSPKDLVGLKERTIEVTIGNSNEVITARDPSDVAKVTATTDLKKLLIEAFDKTDEVAKERGFKFMDGGGS